MPQTKPRVLTLGVAVLLAAGLGACRGDWIFWMGGPEAQPGPRAAATRPMEIVFAEGFEYGMTGWTMTDPAAWRIHSDHGDHVLELRGPSTYHPPVRSPHSLALIDGLEVGDFRLQLTMRHTGREYAHRDLCVFFGYRDAAHFYYVHLATRADEHAHSVFRVDGAPRVSIAEQRTGGVDWGGGEHQVVVLRELDTGLIEVYFDNLEDPIMRATDTTFGRGRIGVGSFDDRGYFDDIMIWSSDADGPLVAAH